MATGRKRGGQIPIDLDALLPRLEEPLKQKRALRAADLARLGVPRAQQREAISRLLLRGFEAGKSCVRVPVRQQILELLRERGLVSVNGLAKFVAGASQAEAKTAAEALARDGALRIVLRGKVEALAPTAESTLSTAEIAALGRACKLLASQSAKALRIAVPKTLLRADVRELLLDLVTAGAAVGQGKHDNLEEVVLRELERNVRGSVGLAFVPDAMRPLVNHHSVRSLHGALIQAARDRRIELQPESGVNRLSREELELCPPGPEGTRLSWARLLGSHP
jgi:hypothetical protein